MEYSNVEYNIPQLKYSTLIIVHWFEHSKINDVKYTMYITIKYITVSNSSDNVVYSIVYYKIVNYTNYIIE